MMSLSTIVVLMALSAGPFCGDENVDPGENCSNCPADVQCGLCETCVAGVCVPAPLCPCGDLDGDGDTGISDFLILLSLWGPCP